MSVHFTYIRTLLLLACFIACRSGLYAQVFPVDLSLNIMRPHSPAFHTFGNSTGFGQQVNQIQLFMTLKDSREPMLNVGLEWEIVTERGRYIANPELALIPINLVFGMPTSLSNLQLSTYFSDVSFPPGMLNNGFLPEGACEICATAIELTNRSPVSLKVCAFLFLEELDPPVIMLPLDSIIPYFPQNIQLSWQPLHAASFPVEYTLEIWEMIPGLTPEQIITSTPPLFVKPIQQMTTTFLGPSDPPLLVGSFYLAQVTVRDIVNMGGMPPVYLFKNFGRSPVHIFKYGYTLDDIPCEQPTGLGYDTSDDLETYIFWDGGTIPAQGHGQGIVLGNSESGGNSSSFRSFYNLNWREKNEADPSGTWSNHTTDLAYYNFDDFKRGRTYQVFVEKACPSAMISSDTIEISFSQLPPERPYECGQQPLDLMLQNQTPLQNLFINDTIMAGDTRVIITEAVGSNGNFSGEGFFKAPFIKSIKLAVEFTNIRINDEYRLTEGSIITKWDPTGSNIIDGDGIIDLFNTDEFDVPEVFITDVDSIGIDENGNVIVYHGGGTTTFSQPIIVNSNTGSYTVSGGYVMPILEDFVIPDDLMPGVRLKFYAHENSTFGFDPYDDRIPDQYQSQEDYKIPYKSIGRGLADSLVGILEGDWDINKIMLVSSRGAVLPIKVTGSNSLLIRTAGVDDNEIIYATTDDGSGVGLFFQKSYQYTNYHVHLVKVNDAGNSIDPAELENSMNKILHQGVTLSTVNFHPISVTDTDPDDIIGAQSKLITVYSSDMNRIIRNFVNQVGSGLEENHFYIFLVDNLQGDVAGFMPQGMQFGFVDVSKASGAALSKILTHELGHGAFTLRHYWDDYVGGSGVDHGNLMDYGPAGTRLLVRQWERMHQQRFPLPWLDADGDGQYTLTANAFCIKDQIQEYIMSLVDYHVVDALGRFLLLEPGMKPYYFIEKADEPNNIIAGGCSGIQHNGKVYIPWFSEISSGPSPLYAWSWQGCNQLQGLEKTNCIDQYKITIDTVVDASNNYKVLKEKLEANNCQFIVKKGEQVLNTFLNLCDDCDPSDNDEILVNLTGELLQDNELLNLINHLNDQYKKETASKKLYINKFFITEYGDQEQFDFVINFINGLQLGEVVGWFNVVMDVNGAIQDYDRAATGFYRDKSKITEGSSTCSSSNFYSLLCIINSALSGPTNPSDQASSIFYLGQEVNPITAIMDGLASLTSKLQIPERFYNLDNPEYSPVVFSIFHYAEFINNVSSFGLLSQTWSEDLIKIAFQNYEIPIDNLSISKLKFALICGMWNELVSQIQSLPQLTGILLTQSPDIILRLTFDPQSVFHEIAGINISNTLTAANAAVNNIGQIFIESYNVESPYMLAQQLGRDATFSVTLFFGLAELKALKSGFSFAQMISKSKAVVANTKCMQLLSGNAKKLVLISFLNVQTPSFNLVKYVVQHGTDAITAVIKKGPHSTNTYTNLLDDIIYAKSPTNITIDGVQYSKQVNQAKKVHNLKVGEQIGHQQVDIIQNISREVYANEYINMHGVSVIVLSDALTDSDDYPQDKCDICPNVEENYLKSPLCEELHSLSEKYPDQLSNIQKLCNIVQPLTVVSKINTMPVSSGNHFLSDLSVGNDVHYLSNHTSSLAAGHVEAWELVNEARPNLKYRKDWSVLQEVKQYLVANSISYVGGSAGLITVIEKNSSAPCNVCDNNNNQYNYLDKYVDYVQNFTDHYTNKDHYDIVLGPQGIKAKGIHQVNASAFVLRVLKENPEYQYSITSFEEKIESINDAGETHKAIADIMINGSKIVECKSWNLNGIAFQHFVAGNSTSVDQFIAYLSDAALVSSMNDIEYWFDKKKLSNSTNTTPIREKFRDMMYQNGILTQRGNEVFNAIWGNQQLRESFFGVILPPDLVIQKPLKLVDFIEKVIDVNNTLYDFIKIK